MYTDYGKANFDNWIDVGGFDNITYRPNGRVHKLLTKLSIMNILHPFQSFILGQKGLAAKLSMKFNIPLVFYGENDAEWQDWLEDPTPNQEVEITEADELSHQRRMLESAMSELNERERHIFTQRRLIEEPMTLEELSQIYKISRERVRQIEARAFEKVEHSIEQKNQQTQDQDTK